jgi:hypothetical protein
VKKRLAFWLFLVGLALASIPRIIDLLVPPDDLFSAMERLNIEATCFVIGTFLVAAAAIIFIKRRWSAYIENKFRSGPETFVDFNEKEW